MYSNIGKKIKTVTKVVTLGSIILSVIAGAVFCALGNLLGCVLIFLVPLFIWINSFFAYAFGELVDKVSSIEDLILNPDNANSRENPRAEETRASNFQHFE